MHLHGNRLYMLKKIEVSIITTLALTVLFTTPLLANPQLQAGQVIKSLYNKISISLNQQQKLQWFSKQFLNKPYKLGPLGEGINGLYDQSPLYSINEFDCTTYVETVMALALSNNFKQFEMQLIKIRYQGNTPSYLTRNHFMSADWNSNNIKKGYVTDITNTILNKNNKPIFKVASAIIDMPNWLKKLTIKDIKLNNSTYAQARLQKLHKQANQLVSKQAKIQYLPLSVLFKNGTANPYLFKQIPSGSIVEIVRPNWQLKNKIGTNINVSHLGFVFRINDVLYFREASYLKHKVIDIPLTNYLQNYLDSPTIKGVNVLKIH